MIQFGVCVLIMCVVLQGCKRRPADSGRVKLIVAVPASANPDSPYEKLAEKFMAEHPSIEVELLPISGSYYQKLLVMIAGGNGPDLMWMGQSFSEFAQRGILLDISDRLVSGVDLSVINPEVLQWYRYEGRQFGIPFGIDVKFMVYNKRLFDEANLPYPTNEWTLDQFRESARKLTRDRDGDGRIDQYGFMGMLDFALFDARVVADDGSGALCDQPAMIEFLSTNLAMRNQERVALPAPKKSDEAISAFRQNRVAIVQMATWDLPFMRSRFSDMDWDIVANPIGRTHDHWASSQAIVISASTPHADDAWLLCKAFLEESFQHDAAEFSFPANRQVAEALARENSCPPANLRALVIASENLSPYPRVPRLLEIMQAFHEACDAAWTGQLSPQAAMSRAAGEINRTLAEARIDAP